MARPSSIDKLPEDILKKLQELLRDPRVSQLDATAEINKILEAQGEDPVSKSAVNRYSQKMEEVGARLRQSREMASMWIGKLGNQPQGEVGKLLNEMIRTLAFETTMNLADGEKTVAPGVLNKLALAVQRLEAASSINEKRYAEIRKRAREEAAEEVVDGLKESQADGISVELEDSIRRILLGQDK